MSDEVKVVRKISNLDLYFVAYVDGTGKKEERIVCRPHGTKQFYFMFHAGAEAAMKPAASWLQSKLDKSVANLTAPPKVDNVKVKVK